MVFTLRNLRIVALAGLLTASVLPPARAVLVGVYDPDTHKLTSQFSLNELVGANAFYQAGVLGYNATVANIEAGYVGTANIPLGSQEILHLPQSADAAGLDDAHATMTGHVLAARGSYDGGDSYYVWEFGMAPMATFYTGAIATSFGENGSFETSPASFFTPYYNAMKGWTADGVTHGAADVINSSWGDSASTNGNDLYALSLDALIFETGKLVVVAAGNEGPAGQVGSPASAMNTIAVGALGGVSDPHPYTTIADFSSTGPNDYYLPTSADGSTGILHEKVRASVDIVAPGESFVLAFNGNDDLVYINAAGTSFAAPTVAGGLALMVDTARQLSGPGVNEITYMGLQLSDKLTDSRVLKAILLTSADRTLPGWTNNQTVTALDGGQSVIRTTQALDWRFGAGAANFANALTVMTSLNTINFGISYVSTTGNPLVNGTGWDFRTLTTGSKFAYETESLLHASDLFSVSIVWFVQAGYTLGESANGTDVNLTGATYGSFADLNLRVYIKGASDDLYKLFAESISPYNAVELLQLELPYDAYLMFEVSEDGYVYNFTGADSVDYGISWQTTAIPEPATYVLLFGLTTLVIAVWRRRKV